MDFQYTEDMNCHLKSLKVALCIHRRSIVPHTVDLIVKYDCHINVEKTNHDKCTKYCYTPDHKIGVSSSKTSCLACEAHFL